MMNAAAPITGGSLCPIVDAVASNAHAWTLVYPARIIVGIVTDPVVITFATADPEKEPNIPDEITATFAGPPRDLPNRRNVVALM